MSKARALLAMTITGLLVAAARGALRASQEPASEGIRDFVLGEFGGVSRATLETNALPYKVVATALLASEERATSRALSRSDLPDLYRRFGFLFPTHIANWPGGTAEPRFERPIGMIGHSLSGPTPAVRVDAVTLGCATCHSARLYGADGRATDSVWVGMPNTSIDLESYTQAVYSGLKTAMEDQGAFRSRISKLFPETGWTERFTLRYVLLPRIAKRFREYAAAGDVPLPFSNGGPGFTNGVASLKHMVGVPPGVVSGPPDVGFTSIPNLSSRALRSSLLYDGVYAPVGAEHFTPLDGPRHGVARRFLGRHHCVLHGVDDGSEPRRRRACDSTGAGRRRLARDAVSVAAISRRDRLDANASRRGRVRTTVHPVSWHIRRSHAAQARLVPESSRAAERHGDRLGALGRYR